MSIKKGQSNRRQKQESMGAKKKKKWGQWGSRELVK
jgi:hypothetical protein